VIGDYVYRARNIKKSFHTWCDIDPLQAIGDYVNRARNTKTSFHTWCDVGPLQVIFVNGARNIKRIFIHSVTLVACK
jgi:hypothetical protein